MSANRRMALRVVWALRAEPPAASREVLEMLGIIDPGGRTILPDPTSSLRLPPAGKGTVGNIDEPRPSRVSTPPGLRCLPPVTFPPRHRRRRGLQAELEELERSDPDVAAATRSYDAMVARVTSKPRPDEVEVKRLVAVGVTPAVAATVAAPAVQQRAQRPQRRWTDQEATTAVRQLTDVGLSTAEIATSLGLSARVVRTHQRDSR